MRRRDWLYFLSGLFFVAIFIDWLYQPFAKPVPHTFISMVTNTATASVFRFKNDGAADIFLSRMILETNSPAGWMSAGVSNCLADQLVHVRGSRDVTIAAPAGNGAWRLRVVYGVQISGPNLLFAKAVFAISQHQWPGAALSVFVGSNSVCSPQMVR